MTGSCSTAARATATVPTYQPQTTQPPGSPGTPYQTGSSASGISYGQAQLSIAWDAASGATSYNVVDPDQGDAIVKGGMTGTSTTIDGLYPGATIHLAVQAVNSAGKTQGGTAVFTLPCPNGYTAQGNECVSNTTKPNPPSAPYEISDETVAQTQYEASLEVGWTPSSNATSQDLIDPNSGQVFVSGLPAYQDSYIIPGLYAGATTHVAVRANNSAGSTTGPGTQFTLPCPDGYQPNGKGCSAVPTQANIDFQAIEVNTAEVGINLSASIILENYGTGAGSVQVTGYVIDVDGVCGDYPEAKVATFESSSTDNVTPGQTYSVLMVSEKPVAACYSGAHLRLMFTLSNGYQEYADAYIGG